MARAMLAEADSTQQAKHILDMAEAARVYGVRQKLGEEAIALATSIKFEAWRRLGEMLKATPKNKGAGRLERPTK